MRSSLPSPPMPFPDQFPQFRHRIIIGTHRLTLFLGMTRYSRSSLGYTTDFFPLFPLKLAANAEGVLGLFKMETGLMLQDDLMGLSQRQDRPNSYGDRSLEKHNTVEEGLNRTLELTVTAGHPRRGKGWPCLSSRQERSALTCLPTSKLAG
jgi:hypothetical protein